MTVSQKQLQRVKVIEKAVEGRVTAGQAALLLRLSERQVKRLKARFEPDSVDWARHGNWGLSKPWALPVAVRQQIVGLARGKYVGFKDTHLTEKLLEVEGLEVSRETVRRTLRQAGVLWPQKRRARKYRSRRERKAQMGMMVLADGSREDWLEGRGPVLTLLGLQDDATSRMLAGRFQLEPEDTVGYLRVVRGMVNGTGFH